MSYPDDSWLRHQRQRWMRHDAHLWIRPDAARWVKPGFDPADIYPTLARKPEAAKAAAFEAELAAEDAAFAAKIAARRRFLAAIRVEVDELKAAMARRRLEEAKYSPSQPRVPAGNPRGGQWTDRSGEVRDLFQIRPDDPRSNAVQLAANDSPDDRAPVRDSAPKIPLDRPETSAERISYLRSAANWLARNTGLAGDIYTGAMKNVEWLRDYHDVVQASRDAPKSLEELQQAVKDPKPGYDVHHIVEQTSAERFGFTRSETEHPENLVRIPRLQHYRITGWYMQGSEEFDGLSPRAYLQDKDWDERYRVGLKALKKFEVLK